MIDDSAGSQIVIMIMSGGVFVIAIGGFIWSFGWASKSLGNVAKTLQKGIQSAARNTAKAGTSAAKNSKYGQAYQQFLGNRKSISALKGREALRGTLEKNPNLMKLMGGVGGGKYAARFLDTEQRKQHAEDVKNLQEGLTGNVASFGVAGRQSVRQALDRGYWADAQGNRVRDVTDGDRAALKKLQSEGYMDKDYNFTKTDPRLANAALGSIMEAEIATPENVQQLASYLRGAGAKENALFTENLQGLAGAKKYKNLQYDDVSDGQVRRYYVKSGGPQMITDPTTGQQRMESEAEAAARGADKVLDSGIRNINKDALDKGMDESLLTAIQRRAQSFTTDEERKSYIIKIADQSKESVEKGPILDELAKRLGTDSDTLTKIQISLRTGGASPMPPGFPGAAATGPAGPPPAQAPPPPGYTQAPSSPLVVPHNSGGGGGPTSNPRPGGNFS